MRKGVKMEGNDKFLVILFIILNVLALGFLIYLIVKKSEPIDTKRSHAVSGHHSHRDSVENRIQADIHNRIIRHKIERPKQHKISLSKEVGDSNPLPVMPANLPSWADLSNPMWNSNAAILTMYFIQVFVYLYKAGSLEMTAPDPLSSINTMLPAGAKAVKMLVYSCPAAVAQPHYGGVVIEYTMPEGVTSFVILRGTQTTCEWNEDAKLSLVAPAWLPSTSGVQVHKGFNEIYTTSTQGYAALRDQIFSYLQTCTSTNIILSGHSLGGGVTYLAAADSAQNYPNLRAKMKFQSVAGPYSGNSQFVDLIMRGSPSSTYSGVFAVINNADGVPTTKPNNSWVRVPYQLFCFDLPGTSSPHYPETYRAGLEQNAVLFDNNAEQGLASCGILCK